MGRPLDCGNGRGPVIPEHHEATERPLVFLSDGHELLGILHLPEGTFDTAVIMLSAGSQYRVGPHRQQLLLARALAERGIAILRYDSSGTADSDGPYRDFEVGADLEAAVAAIRAAVPALKHVVLWGICGSASAILAYRERCADVRGLILVNPWVRSERSEARAYLSHYYWKKIWNASFWRKIFSGRFDFGSALPSFFGIVGSAIRSQPKAPVQDPPAASAMEENAAREPPGDLEERMADGLESFMGRVLIIMSENDLTARKFDEFVRSSKRWRRLLDSSAIERRDLREADHVFSDPRWRDQVIDWMSDWVHDLTRKTISK